MELQDSSQRWEQVFALIDHMLSGNFSHQIPSSAHDDPLEQLAIRLNMLAQTLEAVFKRLAFISPRRTFLFLTQLSFALSKGFKILNAAKEVLSLLNIPRNALIGKNFHELLHPCSREDWKLLQESLPGSGLTHFNLRLLFETPEGLVIRADCSVVEMLDDQPSRYIISFFETAVLEDDFEKLQPDIWRKIVDRDKKANQQNLSEGLSSWELQIVRKLDQVILKELHGPKPDFERFARNNGMTINRLRTIYRRVFQLSPVKYYRRERFEAMKRLVTTTDRPFIEISSSFNLDYAQFSNTFKKMFGKSPKQLRQAKKMDG